jgi:DNA-binding MarR family transcriptional regulator
MAGKLQKELKKLHPFDSVEQEVFLNLQRTADALCRDFDTLLKSVKLSPTQYNVLRILRGAGETGLACREVADQMVTRDPDITRLVDRLEKRGLCTRQRSAADRRVVTTRITTQGLDLIATIDAPIMQIHLQQLSHMGPQKLRQLSDLLEEARTRD